jgi:hypothetical protein
VHLLEEFEKKNTDYHSEKIHQEKKTLHGDTETPPSVLTQYFPDSTAGPYPA